MFRSLFLLKMVTNIKIYDTIAKNIEICKRTRKTNMEENQNVEWKTKWRDEYLKWICGFANAQGGKIYIGTADDGTIVGVQNSKVLLEDIPNKIQTMLGIVADVNLLSSNDKEYIEIIVKPSNFPVNYKGEYHYRSGSTKQQLKGIALADFLVEKTGVRWEDVPVPGIEVEDLDKDSFDIFRREALRSKRMTQADLRISNEELIDSLGLQTEIGMKRAAIMMFHRNPEKWIPGCYTKIGKFRSASDLQYQDEVHGSLFLQADRVIELIYLKYLKAPITYDNMTRIETYPYPKDAVREAYYNALIHSCWFSGTPIQIRIEEEAMYISNDCVFPLGWTAETLMHRHRSKPYNPSIANAFFRAGYVESWGRGIQKICESCRNHGTAQPEYFIHTEDIMVKLSAISQEEIKKVLIRQHGGLNGGLENEIIQTLTEEPGITQKKMSEKLNTPVRTIQRALKKLREEGLVERVGGKKYGYWEIHK